MCVCRGINELAERMFGHGLADCRLQIGNERELEVDINTAADVAVTTRQVVPLQVVDLPEIVLMEAEALVAGESPERRLVRIDQIR